MRVLCAACAYLCFCAHVCLFWAYASINVRVRACILCVCLYACVYDMRVLVYYACAGML